MNQAVAIAATIFRISFSTLGILLGMSDLERKLRDQAAHIQALSDSLDVANKTNVQLRAQVNAVQESAERHLMEAKHLIDQLTDRIEVMVDTWKVQIFARPDIGESEKQKLWAEVVPFRPVRLGETTVKKGPISE